MTQKAVGQPSPVRCDQGLHEACGVFGIFDADEAAQQAFLGLFALQHRGQESAGIVTSDGQRLYRRAKTGEVREVFRLPEQMAALEGRNAIGHNRYSTTGLNVETNNQPILVNTHLGSLALAHNGNLTNSRLERLRLEKEGAIFQTTTDSEIILHLLARSQCETLPGRVAEALNQVTGSYSLVIIARDQVLAARDPHGFKPLCFGRTASGAPVVASESCAFDIIGAEYERDVEPGELLVFSDKGVESIQFAPSTSRAHCVFEYIYFSRPDSKIFGENVDKTRRKLGQNLALEQPAAADITIPVPDSSNTAALGYARYSGISYEMGLIRNHYVGRTFINSRQIERDFSVRLKFNVVEGVLSDKRVVVVDDSIVRGTTLKKLVKLLRGAGAREIHIRISSPPVRFPCFYGMDFPSPEELAANRKDPQQLAEFLGADSVEYMSVETLRRSLYQPAEHFCMACFTGEYPTEIPDRDLGMGKDDLHKE
ncbi:amidophosphoribosyltransferase [bacterium]|nr:amidophosphoribosyltransferase [bacterium]